MMPAYPDFSAGLDSERYDGRPGYWLPLYVLAINLNSSLMNFVPLVIFLHCNFYCLFFRHQLGYLRYFCAHRGQHVMLILDPTMMIISVAAVLAGAVCVVTIFRLFLILPSCPAPVPSPTISTMCKPRCSTPLWSLLSCVLLAT